MTTVASVVERAVSRLCDAGFTRDDARRDAVVLARGVLQWSLADWLGHSADVVEGFEADFAPLVERRASHEPVAYLLGEREFYGRPFHVTRDTLIPRPETEGLVDAALTWLGRRATPVRCIIDVGTGTGCVAIAIALEAPNAAVRIVATDISAPALAVASENAVRLGAGHIEFKLGALLAGTDGPIDLIVSNPPYVPARDRSTLQPDVVRFEPETALFGGTDGLDVIRALIHASCAALAPGGALMMEIGVHQADAITALLCAAGFTLVERHPDLQGIDRIVVAQRPVDSL